MADIRNCIKTHGKNLQESERARLVADADRFEKDGLDTLKAEENAVIEMAKRIQAKIVGKKRVMPWEKADASGFITALTDLIIEGKSPKNNNALRKMLTEHDGKEPSQLRMKQAQEDFELAMINAATKYVANATGSQKEIYKHLVKMYQEQPLLNIRTSTSVDNQAYSTPMPLAYAASVLAGIDQSRSVFEPTAGNGALLIDANPDLVKANELDAKRADRLETLGHDVTTEDATTIVENGTIEPMSVDAIITNPPFGGVSRKVKIDGYKISKIDHLIAAEALRAMKDDGSATLIIGANKVEGEHGAADRIFFNWLYSRYNVTSHFEADGKLYARQGAGWPVRIITVAGRKASDAVSPEATTIIRVRTWDELYEQVENSNTVVDTDWNGIGTDIVISGANLGKGSQPNALTQPVSPEGGADGGLYTAEGQERADRADVGLPDTGDGYGVGVGAIEGERIDEAGRDTGRAPIQLGADQGLRADQRAAPSRPVRVPRRKPERLNETQSVAPTRSTREDGDIRVPTNMEAPLNSALLELEEKVGHVDDFVKERLGYETVEDLHDRLMGLQVDSVAAGIVAIDEGKAIIIADQTGVGKGRQAAALIKHVVDTGRTPVFVTVKDSLFSSMYEDMMDLGNFDYASPFIINQAGFIKVGEGKAAKNIFKNKPAPKHNKAIKEIGVTGKLPGKSNVIFATYSQLNQPNIKRDMISSIATNAVFILDESHNAGGQSQTGEYFTELLSTANAAIYLSATYAKRVDNFPVYNKTDLSMAFDGIEQMQEAVEVGGIGMQTLISSALTENGQLIRRERSFDGIKIETIYDTKNKAKHTKMADSVTEGLRAIVSADRMFHTTAVKALQKATKGDGTAVVGSGNKLAAGVSHTNFTSTVHNIVRQTLLAIKADKAADDAIAALKNGEKPVIALDNTMGSFLDKYTDENGIGFGEDLGAFDFRYVLHRALENSRKVLITDVTGEKSSVEIPLRDLPAVVQKAYKNAEAVIDGIKIDAPVSPIDWIRNKIEGAGYSVKEITGRKEKVIYHPDGAKTYERMDRAETTDKVATASQFNSGDIDVLVINRSGSTGISLHSSEKFKNQDPRVMFVVQASLDINDFQQMLGRINRTGQLKTPRFELNTSVLPSEKRIMSVLSRKMRSLNANTSSNTKSATSVEAEDIFNEYGNAIISRYLKDNAEIDNALDVGHDDPDMAEKVTGRISLLPVEVQEQFYEEVENNYRELIEYLDKTNQNQLEITVRDLQAEELSKEVLTQGKDPSNVFGRDSFVGQYKVKQEGKPPTSEEVQGEIDDSLKGKSPEEYMAALFSSKRKGMDAYKAKLSKRLEKAQAMKDKTDKQKEAKEAVLKRVNEEISNADWRAQEFEEDIARRFTIGKMSRLKIGEDEFIGAVIGIDDNAKVDGNSPYAKSKTTVHFMLNGAMRQIPVSVSRLTGEDSIYVERIPPNVTKKHAFDDVPREGHEMRYIVTGNLISAFSALHGGTIMSYTDKSGVVHNGVMMPKKFNPSTDVKQSSVIRDPAKVIEFLNDTNYHRDSSRFGVAVSDGSLRIIVEGDGFLIQVKSSKAKGGKWYLDPKLVGITGDFSTMRGSKALMSVEVTNAQLLEALPVIQKRSGLFAPDSMTSEAEKYTAQGDVSYSRTRSVKPRTEEFRKWFGYSKVKRPVYHATSADFDAFDTKKGDLGAHFGSEEQADYIAEKRLGEGAKVLEVWLNIRNPIRLKDVGTFHADGIAVQLEKKGLLPKGEGKRIEKEVDSNWRLREKYDPMMRGLITDAGYDGVVYKNEHEGRGDSYIAFNPSQIKSTDNVGAFSIEDERIMFARGKAEPIKASGSTVSDVEGWLGNSLKKLGNWVDVEVVQSVSDMPGAHPGDVRGMFYQGKVYLVADNLTKKSTRTAFAHEVVGHLGLEGLLGREGFNALMRQVTSMKKSGNKEVLEVLKEIEKNYVDKHGRYTLSEAQEAREILAHLAEKKPNFGLVRSMVAKIRMWLAKHGLGNFDNAMIEQLIVRAARQVKESYTGVVSDATAYSRDKTFNDIDSMDYNGIEVKEITDEEQAEFKKYFEQVGAGKAADYATYQTIEGKTAKPGWEEATRIVSEGMPAVIYRAGRSKLTPEKFLQLGGRSNLNQAHLGVFLSSEPEGRYGAYIHEVHLDVRNPKTYKLSDMEALAASGKFNTVEDVKLLALDLMADGHDGIILEKAGDKGEDHFIVFHPNQVIEIPSVEPAYSRAGDSVSSVMEEVYLRERKPAGQNLGMPEETHTDKFVRLFQDSFNRIKKLQETVINKGGTVSIESDVYKAEERSSGKITARLTDLDRNHMRPLIKEMAEKDISLAELDEYMIARHAAERNEYIASINPDMQDGGSGLTTAEAQGILGSFPASKLSALESLADMVYAVNNKALDEMVEGGHLTQETVDEWQDRYNYYVPLKGKEGEDTSIGGGRGFSVSGAGIRAALGRGAGNIAESPVAHTFAQAENTIVRTEKTAVGQALVNLIRENPDPEFWSISQRTFRKFVDLYGEPFEGYETAPEGMVDGLDYHRVKTITNEERLAAQEEDRTPVPQVVYKIDQQYKHRDDVFSVMEEGQELLINIKDPIVAEQLKKMNVTQLNAVVRGAGMVNRYLAMINTALNPEFVITNLERDFQTAMINLSGEQSGKMAYEVMKAMPKAVRGIWQATFDKGESDWRTEFEEMQAEGGTIGFFGLEDIETKVQKIQSKLEDNDSIMGRTGRGLSKVRDVVLDANLSVENAARLAAYKIAKDKWIGEGMSAEEAKAKAASLSKNLTVNFNRKGELAPILNSAYLFYNASIQGSARIVTALGNKRVQKIVGGVAVTAFALAFYNAAAGGDDDDGIPHWDKISDFTKQTNLIIMHPDGSGNYSKIKLPYGYNVFFYAGTAMHDMIYDPRKTVAQTGMNMVSAVMNAFNPIHGADLLDTLTPTVLKPFEQDVRNINFMDAQIKPEFPFDQYERPESEKAWKGTSPELKEMMRAINEATGGDQTHAGLIDISPESVKHYVAWLTGGAGKTATRTVGVATALVTGEDIEQKQIPFIRTLGGKPSSYYDTERFYAAVEEIAAAKEMIKKTKGTKDYMQARREYSSLSRLDSRVKSSKKKIKSLRRRRDRAYNAGNKDLAKEHTELIRQEMMRLSATYDRAIEK